MQVLSVVRTAGSGDPGEALEPRGAEEVEAGGDEGAAVRCRYKSLLGRGIIIIIKRK